MSKTTPRNHFAPSPMEVEELACKITGLDYDEIDADETQIEEALLERFGCDLPQFADMMSRLVPLIDVGSSPLTKERYKGFADTEKQIWLLKMKIEKQKL